jgi:hypothetical protein
MGPKAKMSKLSKRESKQRLAPVTSVIQVRVKQRPRGRSFEKGNGFGSEYRFVKGQPSANPSGRPLCKEITKALVERLASATPLPAKTGAEKIAKKWFEQSMDGNVAAIVSLANRVEGCPATSVAVNGAGDNLPLLLEGLARIHAERYPEGAEDDEGDFPQLTEGTEDGVLPNV